MLTLAASILILIYGMLASMLRTKVLTLGAQRHIIDVSDRYKASALHGLNPESSVDRRSKNEA